MKRLGAMWQSMWGDADRRVRLGRILGLAFLAGGFVAFGLAWNGAASKVRVDSQFPYLLSGGFLGLGLVVTGSALLFLSTVRSERQLMTDKFDEMATLLGRNLSRLAVSANGTTSIGQVIAGPTAYHRPECRVLEGKQGLTTVSVEEAAAEGLVACRVCDPPAPPVQEEEPDEAAQVAAEPVDAAATSGSGKPTP